MCYLAIDIGASSGRHIVADIVDGKLVLNEVHRFSNLPSEDEQGRLFWDTDHLYKEILLGLKKAGEKYSDIRTIAIDTWAVDYALLDADDRLIGKVRSYRDPRGIKASEKVHSVIPFGELYDRSGIQYQPFNTIYQLFDDKETGKMEKAHSMLMLPDYFNFLLTGVKRQEYTNATSTGLVNNITHKWDKEVIAKLGLKEELFGELTQPATVVGCFSEEVRDYVGYNANVILPATHDTASAILAAPIHYGDLYLSSGTWSLLGVQSPICHHDKESMGFNYSNEGDLNYGFRYQKNIMGLWMIQQVRHDLDDKYSFGELADMARKDPTDKVVDCNDNRFLAPHSMIRAIEEVTGKLTIGQLAYCIFHSLAICYDNAIKELERLTGRNYPTLNIIGGGINNTLLNELTAKETGKKIITGPVEATAIGNLLCHLLVDGVIHSVDEGREIIRKSFDIREVKVD